jgi:putative ABC transport system permease protein
MDNLRQDLRHALRMLAKSPGFSAVAILCIALAIGTNVTAFSVVSAVLLRPFPYAEPERLAYIRSVNLKKEVDFGGLSWLDAADFLAQARSFSQGGIYTNRSLAVATGEGEPERISGASITASLFPMLGEKPMLGRHFREDEDRPGAPPVVLLGHDLWVRRFGGDPKIVGQSVMINATAHTVVGVMPPRFAFPDQQEAWVPLAPLAHEELRTDRGLTVMARLAPDVSFQEAEAEVKALASRLASAYPDTNAGWGGVVRTLREEFVDDGMKTVVLTIQGAVIFILLIACANVANLFLARATVRQREVAVRVAFGASRGRIVRQFLTESLVLALLGGVLGIVFGYWGIRWMEASIPAEQSPPYWMRFTIDQTVLLYTLGCTVLTGVLFGLAPALQAVKQDFHGTLKEGGRGAGGSVQRNRLRSSLVVAEIALALTLLVVTSLFLRSFLELQNGNVGFSTANILTLRIYLPGARYEEEAPKVRRVEDVVRRLEALPGIETVAASNMVPLWGGGGGGSLVLQSRPFPRGEEPSLTWTGATSGFFPAIGLSVVRGRPLTEREGMERSAVAMVNESFAKRFFPKAEVLGQRFRVQEEAEMGWITIVGVVPNAKLLGADETRIPPLAFLPYPYLSSRSTGLTIRTRLDPAEALAQMRKEIQASDPEMPIYQVFTMEQIRQQNFWEYRFLGGMFLVFGAIALFLAAIGVYGVLSYSVSQRVREIGIRMALGSQRGDVLRLVVGQGVRLALIGVGIGLLLAFGAGRAVASVLFGVSPSDPISFGTVAILLTLVASFASYLPASRAMRVDPLEALRNE